MISEVDLRSHSAFCFVGASLLCVFESQKLVTFGNCGIDINELVTSLLLNGDGTNLQLVFEPSQLFSLYSHTEQIIKSVG